MVNLWLYWVWIGVALVMVYVVSNCVYLRDRHGRPTDKKFQLPAWSYIIMAVVPFLPAINVLAIVGVCYMLTISERAGKICLRGRFFSEPTEEVGKADDVKEKSFSSQQKAKPADAEGKWFDQFTPKKPKARSSKRSTPKSGNVISK